MNAIRPPPRVGPSLPCPICRTVLGLPTRGTQPEWLRLVSGAREPASGPVGLRTRAPHRHFRIPSEDRDGRPMRPESNQTKLKKNKIVLEHGPRGGFAQPGAGSLRARLSERVADERRTDRLSPQRGPGVDASRSSSTSFASICS